MTSTTSSRQQFFVKKNGQPNWLANSSRKPPADSYNERTYGTSSRVADLAPKREPKNRAVLTGIWMVAVLVALAIIWLASSYLEFGHNASDTDQDSTGETRKTPWHKDVSAAPNTGGRAAPTDASFLATFRPHSRASSPVMGMASAGPAMHLVAGAGTGSVPQRKSDSVCNLVSGSGAVGQLKGCLSQMD